MNRYYIFKYEYGYHRRFHSAPVALWIALRDAFTPPPF